VVLGISDISYVDNEILIDGDRVVECVFAGTHAESSSRLATENVRGAGCGALGASIYVPTPWDPSAPGILVQVGVLKAKPGA
jgi:hypothetical protein